LKKALAVLLMVLVTIILVVSFILAGCTTQTTTTPTPAISTAPASSTTPSSTTPAAKLITIKYGYDTPPTTNLGVPAEFFAKEINTRLAGKVKVDTYPAGSLSSQGTGLENVRNGVADIYILSFGANLQSFPVMNFTSLPGLNFYPDSLTDMENEVNNMRAIIAKYPAAQEELKGLKLIWSDIYSTAVCMGKTQIKVPADTVGKKIGCDGMRQEVVLTCGGTPVFTIPPQMYQQIQNGVCDSVLVSWGAAMDWQLQEQIKYVLDFSFGGSQMAVMMNEKSYNKMDTATKAMFDEVCTASENINRQEVDKSIKLAKEKWAKAGVTVYKPTADEQKLWLDRYAIIWQKYLDTNKAIPAAKDIFNDLKMAVDNAHKGS
jgi:TRAP-type transport system periplasmic protein